jgi:hypothetical protein
MADDRCAHPRIILAAFGSTFEVKQRSTQLKLTVPIRRRLPQGRIVFQFVQEIRRPITQSDSYRHFVGRAQALRLY